VGDEFLWKMEDLDDTEFQDWFESYFIKTDQIKFFIKRNSIAQQQSVRT
jgi:hypothetical protein